MNLLVKLRVRRTNAIERVDTLFPSVRPQNDLIVFGRVGRVYCRSAHGPLHHPNVATVLSHRRHKDGIAFRDVDCLIQDADRCQQIELGIQIRLEVS